MLLTFRSPDHARSPDHPIKWLLNAIAPCAGLQPPSQSASLLDLLCSPGRGGVGLCLFIVLLELVELARDRPRSRGDLQVWLEHLRLLSELGVGFLAGDLLGRDANPVILLHLKQLCDVVAGNHKRRNAVLVFGAATA